MFTKFIDRKTVAYKKINPERFYVENIRSFFGVSYFIAELLCDMAVKEGLFVKKYYVECPNCKRVLKSFKTQNSIPKNIECDICENLETKYEFEVENLKVKSIYALKK